MIYKRRGKCATCQVPTTETKQFDTQTNLFNKTVDAPLTTDLVTNLMEWRESPMFCDNHKGGRTNQ